jgi:hypothetical protein
MGGYEDEEQKIEESKNRRVQEGGLISSGA